MFLLDFVLFSILCFYVLSKNENIYILVAHIKTISCIKLSFGTLIVN